jgi:hypothetical protein
MFNIILLCWKNVDENYFNTKNNNKTNPVAGVHERIIPTERQPLVGEVSANFSGLRVPRGQREVQTANIVNCIIKVTHSA